jgi:hypothetical protein
MIQFRTVCCQKCTVCNNTKPLSQCNSQEYDRCSARRQATHAAKPHVRVVLDCKKGWRSCSIRAGNPFTFEQPPHSKTLDKCCFLCSISPRIAHANTASARPCNLSPSCCRMYGGSEPLDCTKDSPNNALHQLSVAMRKATLRTAEACAQSMCVSSSALAFNFAQTSRTCLSRRDS